MVGETGTLVEGSLFILCTSEHLIKMDHVHPTNTKSNFIRSRNVVKVGMALELAAEHMCYVV